MAAKEKNVEQDTTITTYDNKSITYTGNLESYDYASILKDKQGNIYKFFELSDYYVDADPMYRGIIKGVYTPFSVSEWKLVGANESVISKYENFYEQIGLADKMWSIFYQYYKYGNTYIYMMDDGNLITLPVHKVRISNVVWNGEPVLEYDAGSITTDVKQQSDKAQKEWIEDEDLNERLRGYPNEVAEAIRNRKKWVQLDPERTFVLQDIKEDWVRYAIPMIAACLRAFSKKAIIENYEDALLNLSIHSFLHVKYGDTKNDFLPNIQQLRQVDALFRQGMTGSNAIVTTNPYATAEFIQPDTTDLFRYDKYNGVNSEILSAGGISGIIVSGQAGDGSTFATAQVSTQMAALRIKQARKNFCEMMNKVNKRLNTNGILPHSANGSIPEFTFPPVDLTDSAKFKEACKNLWDKGIVSTTTLLDTYGYDAMQEVERKKAEKRNGVAEFLSVISTTGSGKPNEKPANADGGSNGGRPEMDDTERSSDPLKALTSKAPKPSRDGKDSLGL